ncbi:MAG TPA: ATP-binding protein [Ideonella sp.]|nr:ATP-binding protein [Ideonella sp.]
MPARLPSMPLLSKASFRQLLLFAFLLISGLLGAVSLSGLYALQGLMAQSRVAAAQAVGLNSATQGLADRNVGMERASRQYLVLGDDVLRQRFDELANESQSLLTPLVSQRDTAPLAREWLAALTRIRTQIADDRLSRPSREQSINAEFAGLDGLTNRLALKVQQGISDRNQALQNALENKRSELVQQVLAAIVIAAVAALGFGVWLTRPLRQLKRAIVALGENQLDTPVDIQGPADLRSLGQQLDWLRLRLTELDADKARFLRHVSHELKTPLAALREGAALLQDGVAGQLTADQREITGILQHNTALLQRQIEDLLNFNAAAFDARRLQRRPTDLRALVEQVVESQRLQWQARQVKVAIDGEPLVLPVDPDKLGLALGNLMSNAIRFSPLGATVRWSLRSVGAKAVLQISDAGPGVASADRARVFEPFYRGSHQPEGAVRGSGIGLSIVQEYVAAHGGRVNLLPDADGACFRIELPLGT